MKKILILGGSHRDIPLIQASKQLGYFVITLGNRDYYIGHKYSDKYYTVDFNNLNLVEEIIINENIDHILPGCGEESYLKTVELSEKLGIGNFDDLDTAKLIHNKWKFKRFCLENNLSTPKGIFYQSHTDLKNLQFPIVVKPTSLSGGKGVNIVHNQSDLEESLKETRQVSQEIFLEEFIDGELIAYSIFIKNEKILYGFLGKDDTYLNKYLITSAYPTSIKESILTKINSDIEKLAKLLFIVDGMFHLQILIKDDTPYIIDVTRRIAGDLYPYLIEFSTHVKYSQAVVKSYLGLDITNEFNTNKGQVFVIRHCVMPSKNGVFKNLYIDPIIKENIIYRLDLIQTGRKVDDYLNTQIAIVFIRIENKHTYFVKNINQLIYPIISNKHNEQ